MFEAEGALLISPFVAWATGTSAGGVAALCHEIPNDAVEGSAVVKAFARQEDKVVDGLGRLGGKEFDLDIAFIGVHDGPVLFRRIDLHVWRFAILLGHVSLVSVL